MALDPNIILQAGRGVTPLQVYDPVQQGLAEANLSQALQNQQIRGMQIQQAAGAMQREANTRNILKIGRAHV